MKTKQFIYSTAAAVFLILSLNVTAKSDEFTKRISKSFEVDKDATLELKNKFGKIHCSNWDKNSISIEVEITVDASSQERANKYFDRIDVDITGDRNKVSAITNFENKVFNSNGNDISIDFMISMPEAVNLEVNHKFGDLIIENVSGNSSIDLGYGNFDIRKLEGNSNMLDIQFSEGKIVFIKNADLQLKYSELNIDEAISLNAETNFSELEIGKVDVLTLESGYDDGYIGFVRDLDIEAGFSDIEVRSLEERLVAEFDYGELKVKEVGQGFTLIDIENSFADANIGIHSAASFKLVATVKMGDFSYPRDKAKLSVVDLSYTSNKYEGVVGDDENPTARVMIETKNGGVNLYYR